MISPLSKKIIIVALAVVQSTFILYFHRRGVYADQWDLVPILDQFLNGGEWLELTLKLHGGHYHTAAYLIMLPLAAITNWSLAAETGVIVSLNLITFWFLYRSFLTKLTSDRRTTSLLVLLSFSALYFSTAHGGNALWSWQIAVYLTIFGFVVMIYNFAADKLRVINFIAALAGGIVGSYAFSCGFAIWPVGFFLLVLRNGLTGRQRFVYSLIWAVVGLAVLVGFAAQMSEGAPVNLSFSFAELALFLLFYLGTPVAYFSRDLSLFIALIALVLFIYLGVKLMFFNAKPSRTKILTIIALGLFAGICGGLISIGRLQFGLDQARSFRYIIFSQFFWFSLLLLIWENTQITQSLRTHNKGVRLRSSLLSILIVFILFNGQKIGRSVVKDARAYDDLYFQLLTPNPAAFDKVSAYAGYPELAILQQQTAMLRRHGLSVFSGNGRDNK